MGKELRELVHGLDHGTGRILCNKESLEALKIELGHIREDADNTDHTDITSMAIRFRDMYHKIVLMDDLIHFVTEDLNKNYDEICSIKSKLFQKTGIQGGKGEN